MAVSSAIVNGFDVSLTGQVSMAKGLLHDINNYLEYLVNPQIKHDGRRSLTETTQTESAFNVEAIRTAELCQGIKFCKKNHEPFLEDYLIRLSTKVEKVLDDLIENNEAKFMGDPKTYTKLYHNKTHTSELLKEVKEILKNADTGKLESWIWMDVLKKITIKFQEDATLFYDKNFHADPLPEIKYVLLTNLISAFASEEGTIENNICREHKLCAPYFHVTRALKSFFETFKKLTKDQDKELMKSFISLFGPTNFSQSRIRNIWMNIAKVVESRLRILNGSNVKLQPDAFLVNILLSDLDHIYSGIGQLSGTLQNFVNDFNSWAKGVGVNLANVLRDLIVNVKKEFTSTPDALLAKLLMELSIFVQSLESDTL